MTAEDPAQRVAPRVGLKDLPDHLEHAYDVRVRGLTELDLGTYRVDLAGGGAWVARVHPASRPPSRARDDAEILSFLADRRYPAERCAAADPVSELHDQAVVVTGFVAGVPRGQRRAAIVEAGGLRALGAHLAALQALDGAGRTPALTRPGGAWHHLTDGAPSAELAAAGRMLESAAAVAGGAPGASRHHEALRRALAECDAGDGLPETLAHPDFVMANVVATPQRGLVFVDWTGAGRAPRVWPLAFLLWSVGFGGDLARVDRAVAGYRTRAAAPLEPEELERLPAVVAARPVVFEAWACATGRRPAEEAARRVAETRRTAEAIGGRAAAALRR